MFAQEPHVHFVSAEHVTDYEIVCACVAEFIGAVREFAALPNDDLVRVQQTRNLYWNLLPPAGWALDLRGFGNVRRHGDANASQHLNALGNCVHDLDLLGEMLIEQKMQLVEG